MKPENWKKIKELLEEVLSLESSERQKFLNNPQINGEIRAEVESLLAFETEAEDLMKLSAVELSKGFFDDELSESSAIGQDFGVYRIVQELGYGGMGAVYLAERTDGKFSQRVALKLLKREMNTSALRRRFQQEREILASLEHPNIARLLDAGTTGDKIPYIAMEYIEGLPIDDFCNKQNLDLSQRLDLFRKICATVDFAHRNLIVHRDLKPSNILVNEEGNPKLLDFGISKILSNEFEQLNSATVTKLGVMTPSYASPEQLQNKSVTTATDIYSLGVILYELLSGHRPFETKENDLKEIYRAVIETDPPLPSSLVETVSKRFKEITEAKTAIQSQKNEETPINNQISETQNNKVRQTTPQVVKLSSQSLRGDLDNIVLKALQKEPERRYSSVENLSEDIERHQKGLPVTARPNTFSYRAEKFFKRNKASVFAGILIALAIVGGIVATLWQARVAQAERVKAEKRFNDVRVLANSFILEFSPKIENLPGSTPARELLVKRALEYLDSLSKEAISDAKLQRELATAYEKVGDVQGNTSNANLGDVKGALKSYEKARIIRQKMLDENPENLQAMDNFANVLDSIADIHANGGDYEKAFTLFDEALKLREKIVERNPDDFDSRAKLADVFRSRGQVDFFSNNNKKAIEFYNRSQKILDQLIIEQPENPKIVESHAYIFISIGEAQGWDNDPENASINLQKGLELFIPLNEKYPNNQMIRRSLMLAYEKRAENYQDKEEFEKSVEVFAKAEEISQISLKFDPLNTQAKRDLAMVNKKMAQGLDQAGKSKESIEKLTFALNIFKELAAEDPNNTEAPYDVANTRFSIGETYMTLKDYDSALQVYQKAEGEFQRVLELNPENNYAKRMLAYNSEGIAKVYMQFAKKGNRQDYLQKALKNHQICFDGLVELKKSGNFGEIDNEAIEEIRKEIEKIKSQVK